MNWRKSRTPNWWRPVNVLCWSVKESYKPRKSPRKNWWPFLPVLFIREGRSSCMYWNNRLCYARLPSGYKETVMTAELLRKKELKSQRRREVAAQKREKEKVWLVSPLIDFAYILLPLFQCYDDGYECWMRRRRTGGTPWTCNCIHFLNLYRNGRSTDCCKRRRVNSTISPVRAVVTTRGHRPQPVVEPDQRRVWPELAET